MCMLILAKAKSLVKEAALKKSAAWNGDGAGIAYVDHKTGMVVIQKGMWKLKDLLDKYYKVLEDGNNNDHAMMIHLRANTRGVTNYQNCHPFHIAHGALGHNGTFFGRGENCVESDTAEVCRTLGHLFTYENISKNFAAVDEAIGYSRVVTLHKEGYHIFSEKDGTWDDDVWFSNPGFK